MEGDWHRHSNNNEACEEYQKKAGKKFSPAAPGQRKLELILRSATLGCNEREKTKKGEGGAEASLA